MQPCGRPEKLSYMGPYEKIIRSYFDACSEGEDTDISAHFSDDATIFDTNHPPVVGKPEIGVFWLKIRSKWQNAKWFVHRVVEDGETAAIEWAMTGDSQGASFVIYGSEHYEFKDGLIIEIRQYWTFDPGNLGGGLINYPYGESGRLEGESID